MQSTVDAIVKQALVTSGRPSGTPTIIEASPMVQLLTGGSGSMLGPGPSAGLSGTSAAAGTRQVSLAQFGLSVASAKGG